MDTMCMNYQCPLKETCQRFKSKPAYGQAYAMYKPVVIDGNIKCENKISVELRVAKIA